MVVVMAFVRRVAVTVVQVIDVVAMRDSHVAATIAVAVGVAGVLGVVRGFTLVVMAVVGAVEVPVVDVIDVAVVRDRHVAAAVAVRVIVACVFDVGAGHRDLSEGCAGLHVSTSDANTVIGTGPGETSRLTRLCPVRPS